jgi:4-hydroxy-tetrahydrodipicolinate reductase
MADTPRAALIGATGRMGRAIAAIADADKTLVIRSAVTSAASAALGADFGELSAGRRSGVVVSADVDQAVRSADVVLDFSRADATSAVLAACRTARKPLVVGTTGHGAPMGREFDQAAREIPLLVAPNTSLGIAVLLEIARIAAGALPPAFGVEISEVHHRGKRDAPSGTALALREALASVRSDSGDIEIASVREGDVAGEHAVSFLGDGEQLRLEHRVTDRAVFARGAVKAAVWLAGKPAGRYGMRDVLRTA